jgi:hypothetical protein
MSGSTVDVWNYLCRLRLTDRAGETSRAQGRLLYTQQFGEICLVAVVLNAFFGAALDAAGLGRPLAADSPDAAGAGRGLANPSKTRCQRKER